MKRHFMHKNPFAMIVVLQINNEEEITFYKQIPYETGISVVSKKNKVDSAYEQNQPI